MEHYFVSFCVLDSVQIFLSFVCLFFSFSFFLPLFFLPYLFFYLAQCTLIAYILSCHTNAAKKSRRAESSQNSDDEEHNSSKSNSIKCSTRCRNDLSVNMELEGMNSLPSSMATLKLNLVSSDLCNRLEGW